MTRRRIMWLVVFGGVALFALWVYSFGAAIRPTYRVAGPSSQTGVAATEWTIAREKPSERWTARDTHGDGTWKEFASPRGAFTRPTATFPHRWLVICLDGVPLTLMQSLWDSGHFREFFRPTATISTLPSDTETALTAALHADPVPGYEHLYFDRARNTLRGGGWVTLSGYGIPYIQQLDYDAPGWSKGLTYLTVRKTYQADLARFRAAFLQSRKPVFIAHIAASDALLHVWTAQQAAPLLLEFDDLLRDLYLDARGDLGIIAFSDHGNTEARSRAVPVEAFLRARGWRVGATLRGPRDVAIPSYGLVGFAAIYCRPESVEQLAEDLRAVEGADVIVSRGPGENRATIRAAGSDAIAHLEWSPDGSRYRYTAIGGDPIGLSALFNRLGAPAKLDSEGFATDADGFADASSALYPDAAARIRAWASDGVVNRSDILLSLRPGYFHGSGAFQHLVSLTSTHGGLERTASLGFAMATFPLPAFIRVANVIPAPLLESASAHPRVR